MQGPMNELQVFLFPELYVFHLEQPQKELKIVA
ncbi:hypothetical protein AB571B5_00253 [Acinetobacter baumannii]|nr:hypothetical protein AB571B5_00253 [Acinetobacter baumannii]